MNHANRLAEILDRTRVYKPFSWKKFHRKLLATGLAGFYERGFFKYDVLFHGEGGGPLNPL